MNLSDDNTYWVTMWLMIFISLCVIVTVLAVCNTINVDRYTSRGYARATLQGSSCATWVKEAK